MRNLNLEDKKFFVRTKLYQHLSGADSESIKLSPAIEFNLPDNSNVSLVIADHDGRKVLTLIDNEFMQKGFYHRDVDFSRLPVGEYVYKIETKSDSQSKNLKLMK